MGKSMGSYSSEGHLGSTELQKRFREGRMSNTFMRASRGKSLGHKFQEEKNTQQGIKRREERVQGILRKWTWAANLPTCFREARNQHAIDGTAWTRHTGAIHGAREVLTAWSTRELHGESLAFEITAICQG